MRFAKTPIAFALCLAACTPILSTEGNFIEDDRLAHLQDGVSSRQDVVDILGSPSMVSTFDPSVWYYAGQQTSQVAFHQPEILNRRVIAVHFADNGTIDSIQELGLKDGQDIMLVDRETPTSSPDTNLIKELLGNLGKFNPKSLTQ